MAGVLKVEELVRVIVYRLKRVTQQVWKLWKCCITALVSRRQIWPQILDPVCVKTANSPQIWPPPEFAIHSQGLLSALLTTRDSLLPTQGLLSAPLPTRD